MNNYLLLLLFYLPGVSIVCSCTYITYSFLLVLFFFWIASMLSFAFVFVGFVLFVAFVLVVLRVSLVVVVLLV